MQPDMIEFIAIAALPILLAITVHEASHGYIAQCLGDNTAYRAGRVTLNPIPHIDLFGTIILPTMLVMLGGGIFGWAKPVPVNFGALRRPKQDMIWVALAGPLSNALMALCWVMLYRLSLSMNGYFSLPLSLMSQVGMQVNYSLMFLNMLPILPLDGGRVLMGILPPAWSHRYAKSERYGLWLLILLMATGLFGKLLRPFIHYMVTLTTGLF